jgi:hypothetical protein
MTVLRRELFWDTPLEGIDPERHARFIVERVLHRGTWDDWLAIREHYGRDRLRELVTQIRDMDPKSLAFCKVVFGLRNEDFRCYTLRSSTPSTWIY